MTQSNFSSLKEFMILDTKEFGQVFTDKNHETIS